MLASPLPCNEFVARLSRVLEEEGFRVDRSFDLQSARGALRIPEACPCPHHGTAECSCQYIVLIVAREASLPVSVVVHGYEQHTRLSIEAPAELHATELTLRGLIERLATPE